MKLIADSGSSKTSWCLLKDDGGVLFSDTEGYNPYFVSSAYIRTSMLEQFNPAINRSDITEVHFYGSGCFPEQAEIVKTALSELFIHSEIFVELDLLAAARALLLDKPGFAAILGTGTNTCMYDGKNITENIDSLGYVLGDEGSGTSMGKQLLADYIRGYMPSEAYHLFHSTFELNKEQIFSRIYTEPFPNRFCAGFTRFIQDNINEPYYRELVTSSFHLFFQNLVTRYQHYSENTFNCVGSIGFVFKGILREVAAAYGMQTGVIMQSPLEGLRNYHADTKTGLYAS